MGLQGAVLGLAGFAGPMAGAVLRDATDTWVFTIAVVIAVLVVSAALLGRYLEPG